MTDHQKAVCYDTLKQQLGNGALEALTGKSLLGVMNDMETRMGYTNTIRSPTRIIPEEKTQ